MPLPYLRETTHGHTVYSVGELEVICRVLAQHETEFAYLTSQHTVIVETLFQFVHAHRAHNI